MYKSEQLLFSNKHKLQKYLCTGGFCARSKLTITPDMKPYATPFSNRQKIGAAQPFM